MFDRYYCIRNENICYILRYFLHFFVSPFYRCLANVISTDYAPSRAGQYTSRNGSNSVVPVRSYCKLRSHALTARELLIHGFSPVNARMLIHNNIHLFMSNTSKSIFSDLTHQYLPFITTHQFLPFHILQNNINLSISNAPITTFSYLMHQ